MSITLSVLLHAALLGALVYCWMLFRHPPQPAPTLAIEARVPEHARQADLRQPAIAVARRQFEGRPRGESLEEDLFALIAAELRGLRQYRGYLRPVLEALSPIARAEASPEGRQS